LKIDIEYKASADDYWAAAVSAFTAGNLAVQTVHQL
jgi:hypothetical protein